MNFGLPRTRRKFFNVSEMLGSGALPTFFGSWKQIRTAKNIRKTLRAATRKTFSTPRWRCAQDATYGPAAPPMLPLVKSWDYPLAGSFSLEDRAGVRMPPGLTFGSPSDGKWGRRPPKTPGGVRFLRERST